MKVGDSAVWLTNLKKIDLNNTVCTYAGRTKFKFAFNEWRDFYKEIKGGETFYKCDENTTYYVFTTIESLNRYIETLDIINKVNDLCKKRSFYWSLEDAHEIFGLLKKIDKRSRK